MNIEVFSKSAATETKKSFHILNLIPVVERAVRACSKTTAMRKTFAMLLLLAMLLPIVSPVPALAPKELTAEQQFTAQLFETPEASSTGDYLQDYAESFFFLVQRIEQFLWSRR